MHSKITEIETDVSHFDTIFKEKIDSLNYEKVSVTLERYRGEILLEVVNILLHAIDRDKVKSVLEILEIHWEEHLQFQHPEIMGKVSNDLGINPTQVMFFQIYHNVLGIQLQR